MFYSITPFSVLLFVIALWLIAGPFLNRENNLHRQIVAIVSVALGVRYLIWRYVYTVSSAASLTLDQAWIVFIFYIEVLAFFEICLFCLIMSKTNARSKEADVYEKELTQFPSVDVFIPTYNEELDVLEKTIIGAKHLDYPDFKVWILDDGRRLWLKEYCSEKNVGYLTRTDNLHAKAGNMNSGLSNTSGELFAIFDADFVPARNFLRRTVGFFVYHEDIGIVQTPQHFFNKDPIQSNLYLDRIWPDEQRLFFDAIAPCRDSWNAAFCCGSCSIIRRKAVDMVGGIPTSSITEDILTTLSLLTVNYRTIYLNEKLSQGMAAQSVAGYFIQRARWCRGGIQCMFVKEGPLRAEKLTLLQRILFLPYGWIVQPITRGMLLTIPIVYLLFGLAPLHYTSIDDIILYQFPMLLMSVLSIRWLAPKKYVPIISTAIGVFSMFRLLPVAVSSLIKPFGVPFRVTPKGSASKVGVDWYIFETVLIFLALTLFGILINLVPEYRKLTTMEFFPYALIWSGLNIFILLICALICFDTPHKRAEERFVVNEETTICGQKAIIENLSLKGCNIKHSYGKRIVKKGDSLTVTIADISSPLEAKVLNSNDKEIHCSFVDFSTQERDELIVKLYTGKYNNEVYETQSIKEIFGSLFRRAFGQELT